MSHGSYEDRKLVLSGGVASTPLMHEIFDVVGTSTPRIVFDGSPSVTQESFDKKRKMWNLVAAEFGMPEPLWLQDYVDEPLSRSKTNALLDNADVLYVTGGASRKTIAQWNEATITDDIKARVESGEITAAGGSAGAMIWFGVGVSDSESYDVQGGQSWEYQSVREAALFDAWVIAHYSDSDNLGRDKRATFTDFLRRHRGEWSNAIGLDTCAALVCIGGIAHVRDITPQSKIGEGLGASVYLHSQDNIEQPNKLYDGDLMPLAEL